MKVLLVNKFVEGSGGADVHVNLLRKALDSAGHDTLILTTGQAYDPEGIVTIPASVSHDSRDLLGGRASAAVAAAAVWNPRAFHESRALIERFRPDVVHAHKLYPQLSVAPIVAAGRLRVPVVQTLHDYEFIAASPVDSTGRAVDRNETRFSYRALNTGLFLLKRRIHRPRVDAFVAVSQRVADLHALHGIRASVLPNFTTSEPTVARPYETRPHVAFVGRLTPEKGVADVLRLAREAPELPVMIAGDGPMRDAVLDAAVGLSNLVYLGRLDASGVLETLREARVLVMPSRWEEPGPLTLLEAFSVGTPVVTYDRGGAGEYVRDSGGGIVVGERGLRESVRSIFHDRELFARLSAKASRAAVTRHGPSNYVRRLVEIYEQVAEAPRV